MELHNKNNLPFLISIIAVLTTTVFIIICSVSCASSKIYFKSCYYFVCYAMEENAISAGSFSEAVSSYGGAGYILEYQGMYYVTVACYYERADAQNICQTLKTKDMDCSVLEIITDEYVLKTSMARKNAKLYTGNLNTLHSLSMLAYTCANALDTGEYGQSQAKSVIADVKNGLSGLLSSNADNCFTVEINRLLAICRDAESGIIYSKDLRKLQIAITDTIINIQLN